MKRFLRSKLVLTLAAFLMIAAAIVIPLSGSIAGSHAQAAPTITLSPTSGPPGTVVKVTGSGWTPNRLIDIRLGTSGPSTVTLTTASDGTFSTTVTIPANAAVGPLTISADLAGVTALATFSVTSALPPPDFTRSVVCEPSAMLKGPGVREDRECSLSNDVTIPDHVVGCATELGVKALQALALAVGQPELVPLIEELDRLNTLREFVTVKTNLERAVKLAGFLLPTECITGLADLITHGQFKALGLCLSNAACTKQLEKQLPIH